MDRVSKPAFMSIRLYRNAATGSFIHAHVGNNARYYSSSAKERQNTAHARICSWRRPSFLCRSHFVFYFPSFSSPGRFISIG